MNKKNDDRYFPHKIFVNTPREEKLNGMIMLKLFIERERRKNRGLYDKKNPYTLLKI